MGMMLVTTKAKGSRIDKGFMRHDLDDYLRLLGFENLAGVDEAGRGPLAGPVVACAIVLPPYVRLKGVNDSKALSEDERKRALPSILETALNCSVGISFHDEIDRVNIRNASLLAMERAVDGLEMDPDLCLIDGRDVPQGLEYPAVAFVKGDSRSLSIAAASIVAKQVRDSIMEAMHEEFPMYGFDKHKGYPTKLHRLMLEEFGPCKYHRMTFNGVRELTR